MGFSAGALYHLTWLARDGHIAKNARYLDLGSQNIFGGLSEDAARMLYSLMGNADKFRPEHIKEGTKAEVMLTAAGFDYVAFDTFDEGRTRAFDLNTKSVSWLQRGTFDIVANYGTSEHVANQYNLFKVAHDALRVGGVMHSFVPFFGNPNHGLVSYQPKFFATLIINNRYQTLYIDMSDVFPCIHDRYEEVSMAGNGAAWEDKFVGAAMMNVMFKKQHNTKFRPPTDVVLKGENYPYAPKINDVLRTAPPWKPL